MPTAASTSLRTLYTVQPMNISYMAHPGIHQTILNTDCALNGRVLSFYIAPLVEVTDSSIPFKDFVRPWMIQKEYKWKRIA